MKKILPILIIVSFLSPISRIYAVNSVIPVVNNPIRILLVPGHDSVVWGAQYGNTKEADMTLEVATQIYNSLKQDKRFEVYITRDASGYTKEFSDYFNNHLADIIAFEKKDKTEMQLAIADGSFIQKQNAPHHTVSSDIAWRLYGFNKWADENKIDAVIHIHFNDYPLKTKWTIGKYTGFAIYYPDKQFVNSKESNQLAVSIFKQLNKKYSTSTYKPEKGGIVPDQKLIAIGANNTLDASVRSALIEYSYIYEKKFRTKAGRLLAYKNMASLTVTGIKNYFIKSN